VKPDNMVRLKDIAKRSGVSVMTVSKALRDAPDVSASTKTRIKLLAQQMGYLPDSTAQGLRTRTTKLFGLVFSSLTNPIYSRIVLSIEERAYEMGYDVLLAHTLNIPEREEACIRRFLSRRVDGLFIAPVYRMATEARIYQDLLARRVPTVLLGHPAPFCSQFVSVESDDIAASYAATQHLLKLGHKRIAFLTGPPATPWTQERLEGYRRALREAGLEVDDKLLKTERRLLYRWSMNRRTPPRSRRSTTSWRSVAARRSSTRGFAFPRIFLWWALGTCWWALTSGRH